MQIEEGGVRLYPYSKQNTSPVTAEEVKTALFGIDDGTGPGPSLSSSCFFKKAWDVVGLSEAVLEFLKVPVEADKAHRDWS